MLEKPKTLLLDARNGGRSSEDPAVGLAQIARRGRCWVREQRALFRPSCRSLSLAEIRAYEPQFSSSFLRQVRVGVVARLPLPPPHCPTTVHLLQDLLDFSGVEALTLADTVLLSRARMPPPARITLLLFHELVHALQFHHLGLSRFLSAYMDGWVKHRY
ncbi:MAG: hypothetical protein ACE5ID_04075, partial [Acidobacteriota bacterium]